MQKYDKAGLFYNPRMPVQRYLAGAASGGHQHILDWATSVIQQKGPHLLEIAKAAAMNGHLPILKWAHSRGSFGTVKLCTWAAQGGHLDCLQWAHETGYPLEDRFHAAKDMSLEVLQWLLQQGCQWNGCVYIEAASAGKLDIIKWAHREGMPWPPSRWRDEEVPGSTLSAERWAQDPTGLRFPKGKFLKAAAINGHLHILEWAHQNGWAAMMAELHHEPMFGQYWRIHMEAGWGTHIPVLQWALDHGFSRDSGPCERAAGKLDLKLLKWLRANYYPLSKVTFEKAVGSHDRSRSPLRMHILRWLKSNRCPWGKEATGTAARIIDDARNPKNTEPLKWLIQNGCPQSVMMVDSLVQRGFAGLALWVQRRGAACKGPAKAALELYSKQQQELCRCFALAGKACGTSAKLQMQFTAMAAVPWELQHHIAQLAFASICRNGRYG